MAKIFCGKRLLFEADVADGFFSKLLGIMFQGTPLRPKFEKPLLFEFEAETRLANSTHSMFCFTPYDAVFLDSGGKITEVMPGIPPWRVSIVPKEKFKYLIELPPGWAKKFGLEKGTVLSFVL